MSYFISQQIKICIGNRNANISKALPLILSSLSNLMMCIDAENGSNNIGLSGAFMYIPVQLPHSPGR